MPRRACARSSRASALLRSAHDDQARVATPSAALRAGADLLVIGRAVTAAADPEAAAAAIRAEVAAELKGLHPG